MIRKNDRLKNKFFKYDMILYYAMLFMIIEKFGTKNQFIYFQF